MFKEQKENMVRVYSWTKHPCVPLSFDDCDQYLDFMSVWAGDWSSCDPGHMERTDFSDEDCFGGADSVGIYSASGMGDVEDDTDNLENFVAFGNVGDAEWFLEKDRSSALRRRSTALHKLHVQAVAEILSAKSNSKSNQEKVFQSPSIKIYKRVSFPRTQPVKLTTLDEELNALRQHLSKADFDEISCHFFYSYELEVSHLCSLERTISSKPNFGHTKSYAKYDELYSRKTHHEKKRAKSGLKTTQMDEDVTVGITSECDEKASETCNSAKKNFIDRHAVSLRSTTPALPVSLQKAKFPVALAKPQHVTLVFPYVSMAGLPFHR